MDDIDQPIIEDDETINYLPDENWALKGIICVLSIIVIFLLLKK